MSRRFNRRGSGGGRGSQTPPITGTPGFVGTASAANRYETAEATGLVGSAVTGLWMACLFMVNSQAVVSSNKTPAAAFGVGGWRLLTTTTNAACNFNCITGASPAYTFVANDIGKLFLAVGLIDVVGAIARLYVNGAQVGAGTVVASYGPLTSGAGTTMGATTAGNHSSGLSVFGLCGGSTIPSDGEILQLFADVKAARSIVAIPGKTTNMWAMPPTLAAPATVTDSVGAVNMSRVGSLAMTRSVAPFSY
jgi:hypothetical protein